MTLVLPGERRVRALGGGIEPDSHDGSHYGCGYPYFCTYSGANYTGSIQARLYYCRDYFLPYLFRSYINNQTRGTIAVFKDVNGRNIGQSCIAYCGNPNHTNNHVRVIRPC